MAKLKNMTGTNNGYPSHLRDIQDDHCIEEKDKENLLVSIDEEIMKRNLQQDRLQEEIG